jgi:hypothetical protein
MLEALTLGGVAAIHPVIAGGAIVALALLVGLEIAAKLSGTASPLLVHCTTLLAALALIASVLATGPQGTVVGKALGFLAIALAGGAAVAGVLILRRPAPTPASETAPTDDAV